MKNVFLEAGQRFILSTFSWLQEGKEESDIDRRNDYSDFGILRDLGEEFNIVIGDNNNPPTTHSINVRPGTAYDTNGERIEISSPIAAFDSSAPTSTSPNGKGGTVVTPQSTGSLNIVLTPNVNNFIWIDYLGTRDTTEFTLHKITNEKQYYKQDNGFEITVTLVDTPPTAASLKIGNVDLTSGGVVSGSTISLVGQVFGGNKVNRNKIKTGKLDRSDATASYGHEADLFLDDHIKALGTGLISPNNPHALNAFDIGLNTEEILETHQKFMHSSGVIGDVTSTTSSLHLELVVISPGEDFVRIKPIFPTEVALVDGITITNSDIPAEVILLFSSVTDATNTYYVFINKNTKQVQRSNINPAGDASKLPLWSFTWTANIGAPNDGNITNVVDRRDFSTDVFPAFAPDGSATDPVYSFNASKSTGIYSSGLDTLSFSTDGVFAGEVSDAQRWLFNDGTTALPVLSFASNPISGMYLSAPNQVSIATNATEGLTIDASQNVDIPNGTLTIDQNLTVTSGGVIVTAGDLIMNAGQIKGIIGSVGTPTYSFFTDPDTGIYLVSSDTLGITTGNTQAARIDSNGIRVNSIGYKFLAAPSVGMEQSGGTLILRTGAAANPFSIADNGTITSTANHTFTNQSMLVEGNIILPIIQIVRTTTNTENFVSSSSFTTVLSVSISPKFSTSQILVIASGNYTQDPNTLGHATISRDGFNLAPTSAGFHSGIPNNNNHISMQVYDAPGTTASTTYQVQIRKTVGGGNSRFVVTPGGGIPAAGVITAIELAQ